ncbi:hypothetical protein ACFL0L_02815 [Patescibacteria group bacterium]
MDLSSSNKKTLAIELVLFITVVTSFMLFWESTLLASGLIFLIVIIGFIFFHSKEDIVFFVIGMILGTVGEIICTHFNIWTYFNPSLLGVTLWVPMVWGFAFLFARRIRDTFFKLTHIQIHYEHHSRLPHQVTILFLDLLLYLTTTIVTLFLWETNIALTLVLTFMLILSLLKFHKRADFFFIILAMIIGTIVEIIATHIGVWEHGNQYIFKIPLWIPALYGLFALIVRRTSITVNRLLFSKHDGLQKPVDRVN